jgi:hypothetical protein
MLFFALAHESTVISRVYGVQTPPMHAAATVERTQTYTRVHRVALQRASNAFRIDTRCAASTARLAP